MEFSFTFEMHECKIRSMAIILLFVNKKLTVLTHVQGQTTIPFQKQNFDQNPVKQYKYISHHENL
jgi:hypothetical protein